MKAQKTFSTTTHHRALHDISEFQSCHCPKGILCSSYHLLWSTQHIFPPLSHLLPHRSDISTTQVSNCPPSDPPLPLCMAHKPPCHSPLCKFHRPHSTTMGTTSALATPTQLSDQTQLHVPFISVGAACPHGSSVNLCSQSIIYSPTRPRTLHCH